MGHLASMPKHHSSITVECIRALLHVLNSSSMRPGTCLAALMHAINHLAVLQDASMEGHRDLMTVLPLFQGVYKMPFTWLDVARRKMPG